ncbi:MAG TPA: hypothetical protein DCR97_09520 [Deltaproteobacteria bacterium]|nr:hypothetical protein [Deltaproteobacteria bacterium]
MTKKTGAIVQIGQKYIGVSFALRNREISDVQVYESETLSNLKEGLGGGPYGIALHNSSGYLFNLTFPFSGKRKISMVIRSEMEELLPFPTEDMVMDFRETSGGTVLAAAAPKMVLSEIGVFKNVRYIGLQSLSALYALKWAGRLPLKDYLFIHFNGDSVVILGIKDGEPAYLRQFICYEESDSFDQAIAEILAEPDYHPAMCVLVSDNEDAGSRKELIEKVHRIHVDIPSLHESVGTSALPPWLWSGLGAALLALSPKGEVNFAAERRAPLLGTGKIVFCALGCLAGVALLVWALFYLNYSLKQAAFNYLDSQPVQIYKSVFPKSPQIRDIPRAFQEKIRGLERQSPFGTNGTSVLDLLTDLSSKIDSQIDVKIHDFTVDEKEFTFSGTTVSFAALEKIKDTVEKLRGVSSVDLQNVDLAANRQVRFKIRGKL